jgi:uridine phosphorylase
MVPIYSQKYESSPLITAKKHLEYLKDKGFYPSSPPPKWMIFCYSGKFLKETLEKYKMKQCDGCFYHLYYFLDYPGVAIAEFGVGAPAIAMKFELLIEWGVKQFLSIGTAGGLQKNLSIGDIILCDKAIRDEGLSHHYLPPEIMIDAQPGMLGKMARTLQEMHVPYVTGASWTTDAFFRQTVDEVKHYVEMEAAALFAIAKCCKVWLGSAFTISDLHADLEWSPHFRNSRTEEGLRILLEMALKVAMNA